MPFFFWELSASVQSFHLFFSFLLGGLLYIIGGRTNVVNDKYDSESSNVERYDPFTNEWQSMAKLNTPRHRYFNDY